MSKAISSETISFDKPCDSFEALVFKTGFRPDHCYQSHIAVGVSGGADSLALALKLKAFCDKYNLRLSALIVDHGLRPESNAEAKEVCAKLQIYNIDSYVLTISKDMFLNQITGEKSSDLQNRARHGRFQAIHTWCLNNQCRHLFLGHHKNDQAETQIMRLSQNTNLLGFFGIQSHSQFEGIHIHRPLLTLSKAEIQMFLRKNEITWVEDPSNQNENFERVFWRNRLPQQIQFYQSTLPQDIKKWVKRFVDAHGVLHPFGYATLSVAAFRLLPESFQCYCLSFLFQHLGVASYAPPEKRLKRIAALLRENQNQSFLPVTHNGVRLSVRNKMITMAREYKQCEKLVISASRDNDAKWIIWDKRFLIDLPRDNCESSFTVQALGSCHCDSYGNKLPNNMQTWQSLVRAYPHLGKDATPRYALWSLPVLRSTKGLYLPENILQFYKIYIPYSFKANFLGKSLHQSFSFSS